LSGFLQFLFSGITVGAIYALVGLGFSIIYNASHVINFAQGEFVMLGGMGTFFLMAAGLPMIVAAPLAVCLVVLAGLLLEKFAVEPARNASVVTLIIITIGASILIRGVVEVTLGKDFHRLPAFSGEDPINIGGAVLQPQGIWVLAALALVVMALRWFFQRTRLGKALLATSYNPLAAQLVGIETRTILLVSFGLSAGLGVAAASLGGLGGVYGAVAGGLVLGVIEAMAAGYISSAYKDAVAFVIILAVLFFMPSGLFGTKRTERV
jgi:branched-chain amino acid transport system permease protein